MKKSHNKKSTNNKSTKKVNNTKTTNSKSSIENMKYEIASELGVNMGATASSRENGLVGGEMTKRLVQMGEKKYNKSSK